MSANTKTTAAKPRFLQTYSSLAEDAKALSGAAFHVLYVLVFEANHRAEKYRGLTIARGQTVRGRKCLTEITGLTRPTIQLALKALIKHGLVKAEQPWDTKGSMLFTVVNYASYTRNEPRIHELDPLTTRLLTEKTWNTDLQGIRTRVTEADQGTWSESLPPPSKDPLPPPSKDPLPPPSKDPLPHNNIKDNDTNSEPDPPRPPEGGPLKEIEKKGTGSVDGEGDGGACNPVVSGFGYVAHVPARSRELETLPPNPVYTQIWQLYPLTRRGTALSARQGFERWHTEQDHTKPWVFTIEYHRQQLWGFLNYTEQAQNPGVDAKGNRRPRWSGIPTLGQWFESGCCDRSHNYHYDVGRYCDSVRAFAAELGLDPYMSPRDANLYLLPRLVSEMAEGLDFANACARAETLTAPNVGTTVVALALGLREWGDLDPQKQDKVLFVLSRSDIADGENEPVARHIFRVCGGLREALARGGVDIRWLDRVCVPDLAQTPVLEFVVAAVVEVKRLASLRPKPRIPEPGPDDATQSPVVRDFSAKLRAKYPSQNQTPAQTPAQEVADA